jgi:predicted RNA-binding Zn ribbon-like protein
LRQEGQRDRLGAEGVLARARRLRAALRAMYSAVAHGQPPREPELDLLNVELATTLQHARVVPAGHHGSYTWGWSGRNLDAPLWGVIRSAADLLTSDHQLRLVRQCGGDNCDWLFLDTSKNRTRQWCSMRSCGNRAKARRHYARVRRASASRTASSPNTGSAN